MNPQKASISLANISKYLLVIFVPLLIILINFINLSYNRPFFKKIQEQIQSNLNLNDRIRYTNNVIDYYSGTKLLDGNFYSYQARLHLAEVKGLLQAAKFIMALNTIVILLLITILVHEKNYEIIFTGLFYGSLICLFFFLLLGLGISKYFDAMFLSLHKVLFTESLWLFPPTDTLIQLFPNQFFVLFAKQFAINTIATSSVLIMISLTGKYVLKKRPLSS